MRFEFYAGKCTGIRPKAIAARVKEEVLGAGFKV